MGKNQSTVDLSDKGIFAAGCFWSKEFFFSQLPGVISTQVGYTGGHTTSPTYQTVLTKKTSHAEAVEVTFDPTVISFEQLTKYFFEIHNPTIDRREKGGQYRSAIFFRDEGQFKIAQKLMDQLAQKGIQVATTLEPASTFWPAEERHQQYCETRNLTPQSTRTARFS
jgi:methionine-S-sulfoxide reductase